MTDTAIRNAESERDKLAAKVNTAVAQIEEWKRELARIDQFIADWHRFAGTAPKIAEEPPKATAKARPIKNSTKEDVARATREIITVHGAPVQRPVLLNLLRERGLIIEGAEPETVLSTMLWRMSKAAHIIHLKGLGYWTSEKDWPEAGHFPSLVKQLEAEGAFKSLDTDAPRDPDLMHDAAMDHEPEAESDKQAGLGSRNIEREIAGGRRKF